MLKNKSLNIPIVINKSNVLRKKKQRKTKERNPLAVQAFEPMQSYQSDQVKCLHGLPAISDAVAQKMSEEVQAKFSTANISTYMISALNIAVYSFIF